MAAGFTLGVPHPSGFPIYALLAKAASLIPLGSIAFRIHLLSALCAAGTIGFAVLLVTQMVKKEGEQAVWAPALLTAAALLSSYTFVLHGTTAEVYTPTSCAFAAALVCWQRAAAGQEKARLLLAVVTGIGLGTHLSSFALITLVLWFSLFYQDFKTRRTGWVKELSLVTLLVSATVLAYLYLPLASAHDPWRNWGSPDSFARTWNHMSAASIRAAFAGDMWSVGSLTLATNSHAYIMQLWESLGLLAVLGPILTLAGLRQGHYALHSVTTLFVIWGMDAFFSILVNPMGIEDRQTALPSILTLALFAGLGSATLAHALHQIRVRIPSVAALGICLIASAPAVGSAPHTFSRGDVTFPERFVDDLLRHTPASSIVLVGADDAAGLLTGALGVSGRRPDLHLIITPHIYDVRELGHWHRLYGDSIVTPTRLAELQSLASPEGWLSSNHQLELVRQWVQQTTVPVVWSPGEPIFDQRVAQGLEPGFPLSFVTGKAAKNELDPRNLQEQMDRWQTLSGRTLDTPSEGILGEHIRMAARLALRRAKPKDAELLALTALDVAPAAYRTWADLAVIRNKQGDLNGARNACAVSLALRPDRLAPRSHLMELLFRLKDRKALAQQVRVIQDIPHTETIQKQALIWLDELEKEEK